MATCTCVVGLQWGDEAKGKIVDLLTEQHDIVVRYNGGANAGHTVVVGEKKYKLSLLPTGILRSGVKAVIGNGVVVNPQRFVEEADELRSLGVHISDNLLLSDRAHVIFPYHMEEEAASESSTGGTAIGTTGRGIGPCYADKAGRTNAIRVGELLDANQLRERLRLIVPLKNRVLKALNPNAREFDAETVAHEYAARGAQLRPYVADTAQFLHASLQNQKRILFEAAQGSLLDIDHGTYPYVTSSSSSTAGVWSGSGVPSRNLSRVVGVIKAYSTRVGSGPFPTELHDAIGEQIRKTGREYGTVTGRPRRCGWFDAVAVRYSAAIAGADELAVMLLDVLSEQDEVSVCTAYDLDGERITQFPASAAALARCKPVFEKLPGWRTEISEIRKSSALPSAARAYLDRLSKLIGLPISIVSVGPDRAQTIHLR
jgi:adenylosuccinate synthase